MAQTYTLDCQGAVGNMVKLEDLDTGKEGHGISEVKIFGGQSEFSRHHFHKCLLLLTYINIVCASASFPVYTNKMLFFGGTSPRDCKWLVQYHFEHNQRLIVLIE